MLNIQNYVKVKSLDEAYELNQKKGKPHNRRHDVDAYG